MVTLVINQFNSIKINHSTLNVQKNEWISIEFQLNDNVIKF